MIAADNLAAGCGCTVIHAQGRRLAKRIIPKATQGYAAGKLCDLHPWPLPDFDALRRLLSRLSNRHDCCVIRGTVADLARTRGVRRLLHPDTETGEAATVADVPRRWLALDVDGVPLLAGTDPRDLTACARAVLSTLPPAFAAAACIVTATASHGIKPGARLRLWYWADRPMTGAECKAWLRNAPVDRSVFGAAQPIYTAVPIFADGATDPLPERMADLPGEPLLRAPAPADLAPLPRQSEARTPPHPASGNRYALAALIRATAAVRRGAGGRHPTVIREALSLARLIRRGLLTEAEVIRAFQAALADVPGRSTAPHEAEKAVTWALGIAR